jgi:hypothetical protein
MGSGRHRRLPFREADPLAEFLTSIRCMRATYLHLSAISFVRKWPEAAYQKSRCGKAKGALRVVRGLAREQRLNPQ